MLSPAVVAEPLEQKVVSSTSDSVKDSSENCSLSTG